MRAGLAVAAALLRLLPSLWADALARPRRYPLPCGDVLLLDHLNLNHERGRHDLLRAFYLDTLRLTPDPRKAENLALGRKGVWANAGITQFHLPEGERAQVFDGVVTLAARDLPTLAEVRRQCEDPAEVLKQSRFAWREDGAGGLELSDPWGSRFRVVLDPEAFDERGSQPGDLSHLVLSDLCVHVPSDASLEGIARFYETVLRAPALHLSQEEGSVSVVVSPRQTLTFRRVDQSSGDPHAVLETNDRGEIIANDGPHLSIYVRDLEGCFRRAQALGLLFVNTRFKRQAFSIEEAMDQCMFRCLDVVDPLHPEAGPILRLEHEIRSTVNRDGSRYKSCPLRGVS